MEDNKDRKQIRRESVLKRHKKSKDETLEYKNQKHISQDFKYKKKDIEQEELWEEWKDYYK